MMCRYYIMNKNKIKFEDRNNLFGNKVEYKTYNVTFDVPVTLTPEQTLIILS